MLTSTTQITRLGLLGSRGLQLQLQLQSKSTMATVTSRLQRQFVLNAPISTCAAVSRQAARKQPVTQCPSAIRRHASTTTSTATATSTSTSSATPGLDWNTFFALRKTRRRYQQACSIVTMMIGGSLAGLVLINIDVDFLGKLPLDPFITLGLITMSSAALGWLAGPSLGSTIFYIAKRGVKTPMANKEVEFFGRIKKNRVDPSVSSVGNPVPDYYGEKISSVAGYRQWLKDQRAFNKKRTSFL